MRILLGATILASTCTGDPEWTYGGSPSGGSPSIGSQVVAVALMGGARTLVSDASRGRGRVYARMTAAALDAAGARLLVTNAAPDWAVFAVDLATGDRTTISDELTGVGPALSPHGIALDLASGRALVLSGLALYAVDLASGDRTEFPGPGVGTGPSIVLPSGIALDVAGGRAFLSDDALDAILAIDLATGDRTILSDSSTGNGPLYAHADGMAFDVARQRLLVIDDDLFSAGALFAVDLATGDRETISDAVTGSGPAMEAPWDLALDAARNRVLVIDHGRLLAIALDTGNRTVLVDPLGLGAIALDAPRNRILVAFRGG